MAQELKPVTIAAPGFFGKNTQDSPINSPPSFAAEALNCVIDEYGRVGARKGYAYITTDASAITGGSGITTIYEYTASDGTITVFSTGNNKILTGTTSFTNVTPGAYTISAENWKIVELAQHVYFFQRGHEPLVYSEHAATVEKMSSHSHAAGTPPQGNEVLAAFGRLWVADFTTDKHTIYWSDTLDGTVWTGGATGSIDLDNVWPSGTDEIVALAAHNGFLVIFGRRNILIYSGADDPSTMALSDAIKGVGCIARDSVQGTGSDLLFLSERGVMSLGRVVQEKSAPMRDISKNVRNELMTYYAAETTGIKSAYSAEEAFYLLSFESGQRVYCFDMRLLLEDGSARATIWDAIVPHCMHVRADGGLLMGHEGISLYSGYQDDGASYEMQYYSNPLSFDAPSTLKFLKKLAFTIIGGAGASASLKWSYDYKLSYFTASYTISIASGEIAEYGIAEYGIAEYSSGIITARPSVNTGGSGYVVTIGLTATIDGNALSIQQIDALALTGRLI